MRMAVMTAAALAAGCGTASGQSTWTWHADVSAEVVYPGEVVEVTLSAAMTADAPFFALAATIFDVLGSYDEGVGEMTGWTIENQLAELVSDIITTDGRNLFNINAGQLTVFGPFSSDNPIDVLSFMWEAAAPGEVIYETFTDAAVMWIGEDKRSADGLDAEVIVDTTFGWVVVECVADFNGDGLLNVLDFVAFELAWRSGEPEADCDGSGGFDVLDFVCFQQAFLKGCG